MYFLLFLSIPPLFLFFTGTILSFFSPSLFRPFPTVSIWDFSLCISLVLSSGFWQSLLVKWETCKWTRQSWAAFEQSFSSIQVHGQVQCWKSCESVIGKTKIKQTHVWKSEEILNCWSNENILFLPEDAKGLSNSSEVELLRERVYASLESYCKQKYPDQQGR